jgi:serine/threonine-protein kinase
MLVGQQIGPFAVEKELGAGAMGAVYCARHAETGQRVAIKVVAPGLAGNATIMARFKREAAILKQLNHRHIVRLVATGKFRGTPFYAMEYVDGESLDRVMARRGRLTWEEVVEFGQQLCSALQHAHEHGIVHRDLKPSNVMVLPDGAIKLTDFGIAKDLDSTQLTAAHCTVGTASYMSPEQCKGERELTTKSDLYSMGVMFYELVTGRKPFVADNPMDMFTQHLSGTFERPSRLVLDIPVWLDNLICQLLEKKPEQRPLDAAMVARALSQVKEKVLTQRSAGIDAVRTRNVDRPRGRPRFEEEDKEAARTLLGHKKRKKKAVPFYQRRWFHGAVLTAVLLVIAVVVFRAFQPASAAQLYREADKYMADDTPELWSKAREPIQEFLERYPDDPKAPTVLGWDKKIRAKELEDALVSRMNLARRLGRPFAADGPAEQLAYEAERYQDFGDLPMARDRWHELKQKTEKDAKERDWLALAERKLENVGTKAPAPRSAKEKQAEKAARAALVQQKVAEAFKLAERKQTAEARSLAEDVIELYGKNTELNKAVEDAKMVVREVTKAKEKG